MTVLRSRRIPTAAAVLAGALTLAACGSSSSSSTTASPNVTSTTSTSAGAGAPSARKGPQKRAAAHRVPQEAQPRAPQPAPSEVRKAGHAAGFMVGGGDNSVPTYGSEASSSQRRRAESALAAYLAARARENWSTACRYLAAPTRRRLEEVAKGSTGKAAGCGRVLKTFSSTGSGSSSLASPLTHQLASLRVKGENAFALWVGPGQQQYAMPMVDEGQGWRVTQLAPLPYPPGSAP